MQTSSKLFLAAALFCLASCTQAPSACDQWAKDFKDNNELNIVLTKFEKNGAMIYLYGINPKSGKTMEFRESSGWIGGIYSKLAVGDTIVKAKGSYMTLIKKTSYVVKTPLKCEETGQEYADK